MGCVGTVRVACHNLHDTRLTFAFLRYFGGHDAGLSPLKQDLLPEKTTTPANFGVAKHVALHLCGNCTCFGYDRWWCRRQVFGLSFRYPHIHVHVYCPRTRACVLCSSPHNVHVHAAASCEDRRTTRTEARRSTLPCRLALSFTAGTTSRHWYVRPLALDSRFIFSSTSVRFLSSFFRVCFDLQGTLREKGFRLRRSSRTYSVLKRLLFHISTYGISIHMVKKAHRKWGTKRLPRSSLFFFCWQRFCLVHDMLVA